uniref:Uncharacterized protein n=1 Tax=viral metagenome TaxID=1070528 RepID=A0A6M3IMA3_9ZZZZ
MAVVNESITLNRREGNKGVIIFKWTPLTSTNTTGNPIEVPEYTDKTVQVYGTFDSGTVTIQGSNDVEGSPTYFTLNDPSSAALTFTSARGEAILENPRIIQPVLSGAGGTASITVIITCAK